MSKDEAMALPLKERPICYRVSSELYHDTFQAIGEVSMCWKPPPSSEVFNSEHAEKVAVDLLFKIANEVEAKTEPLNVEIERLEKALGDLYWHLTNGKLSKPYDFKAIESVIDDEITELVNKEKEELTDLVLAAMDDPPRQPKDAGNWEERARRAVG